ncbi:MAG: AraC family transcriptional regulator [Duncaniella sp.]|nr:AraC family transcriptional regulator [Duncaniella sp.]MDE5734989.1 AraC family transcriptional regulator [Duncaniella sp.]
MTEPSTSKELAALSAFSTNHTKHPDGYVFTRLKTDGREGSETDIMHAWLENNKGPLRIDGLMWLMCLEGEADLELNLNERHISPGSLFVATPESLIELKRVSSGPIDWCVLNISMEFIKDVNFDLNVLGNSSPVSGPGQKLSVIQLTEEELTGVYKFLDLMSHTASSSAKAVYSKPIARCLTAALIYRMLELYGKRYSELPPEPQQMSRRMSYVHQFFKLVHQHHRRERSVGFYAGKLYITPKYLSLVIKEHTGHSAAQIIDSYVLLEAKNLLRFSGKNIQQVAYELNFPNQSSFGKYFKHLTGLSPSEYQRS